MGCYNNAFKSAIFVILVTVIISACGGAGSTDKTGAKGDQGDGSNGKNAIAPTTPGVFTVQGISVTEIRLEWHVSTDNGTVTGYNIYRDGDFLKNVSATTYIDSGLSSGTSYCYEVAAVDDESNESSRTAQQCASVTAGGMSPTTPGNFKAQVLSTNEVKLSWSASTDDNVVSGYNIYRNWTCIATITELTYTDSGLQPGTGYNYYIVAIDDEYNTSAKTELITATTISDTKWQLRRWTGEFNLYYPVRAAAWSGSRYVVAGDAKAVMISDNGRDWTVHVNSSMQFSKLTDIIWIGSSFVAVENAYNSGYTANFYYSADGINWNKSANSLAGVKINKMTWSGGIAVAVGSEGRIYTSDNGIDWSAQPSGVAGELYSVVWGGEKFIACGFNGIILVSENGLAWTKKSTGTTDMIMAVAYSEGLYLARSQFSSLSSADAETWTLIDSHGNSVSLAGASGNRGFAEISTSGSSVNIRTTSNGVTLDTRATQYGSSGFIIYAGGRYVAGEGNRILISDTGTTWETVASGNCINDAIWDGTRFLTVNNLGTTMTSPDGFVWTYHYPAFNNNYLWSFNSLAWSPSLSRYVAVDNQFYSSPDGILWTKNTNLSQRNFNKVIWGGGQFVATGITTNSNSYGCIYTSANGTDWVEKIFNITNLSLRSIAYSGTAWVAAGSVNSSGAIYRSVNGTDWYNVTPSGCKMLSAITWTGSRFVAAGSGNTVLTSADGTTWGIVNTTGLPVNWNILYINFIDNRYYLYESDHNIYSSTDAVNWGIMDCIDNRSGSIKAMVSSGSRIVGVGDNGKVITIK